MSPESHAPTVAPPKWAKVIDNRKCIGCHACTVACKQEHGVPIGVNRTYVKQVEVGTFPSVRRHFQVTRCNQCDDAPCVEICPTTAMYQRSDGIVDFDRSRCIGCQGCIAACPYDAIYIDPISHSAEKCNLCTHRIDRGLQPACVVVCPTQAIFVGDLSDPESEVSTLLTREKVAVRKPHKGTNPKLFYVGADDSTLTPTAAVFQGAFNQAQPQESSISPGSGPAVAASSSRRTDNPGHTAAAAILAYSDRHKAPWNWIVSMYTWTKSVSAGTFLILGVLGILSYSMGRGYEAAAAAVAAFFLLLTIALLVADLTHPTRFVYVLLKPQWRSWLVRGAVSLVALGGVLVLFLIAVSVDLVGLTQVLRWAGIFVATAAGVYTAFLFGQAKGRDLWQDPSLPLHFLAQIGLAGVAALLLLSAALDPPKDVAVALRWAFVGTLGVHLALALSHQVVHHPTTDGARAARNMLWGRFRFFYWGGVVFGGGLALLLASLGSPTGPLIIAGAALALVGLALYQHAYVQAGQSVPLS
jgi:Fe-S-cluster-containing dehydrogenase component/formate-dependent nitrite reductase membrane component NrfD